MIWYHKVVENAKNILFQAFACWFQLSINNSIIRADWISTIIKCTARRYSQHTLTCAHTHTCTRTCIHKCIELKRYTLCHSIELSLPILILSVILFHYSNANRKKVTWLRPIAYTNLYCMNISRTTVLQKHTYITRNRTRHTICANANIRWFSI